MITITDRHSRVDENQESKRVSRDFDILLRKIDRERQEETDYRESDCDIPNTIYTIITDSRYVKHREEGIKGRGDER